VPSDDNGDTGAGGDDIVLVAAALRADAGDVAAFTDVVLGTLGDTLPSGIVEVDRKRSLADKLAGRDGTPVAVRARFESRELELRSGGLAEIRTVVRGVVLSRKRVPVAEWAQALAEELTALAADNAEARAALSRLLGS
jgi:hypothetical protein